MKTLVLVVVLAFPNHKCIDNLYREFNQCVALLMPSCISPYERPSIEIVKEFTPDKTDACYEIYVSSFSVEANLIIQNRETKP